MVQTNIICYGKCTQNCYEKRIRDKEDGFLTEDYKVFRIMKKVAWYYFYFMHIP
jgi:hypothetical protein